jgi:hypothetical protein
MAPPNTKRKMSRNMMDVTALTTSSCGVRTNWRIVRPAKVLAVAHAVGGGRCAGDAVAAMFMRGLR